MPPPPLWILMARYLPPATFTLLKIAAGASPDTAAGWRRGL